MVDMMYARVCGHADHGAGLGRRGSSYRVLQTHLVLDQYPRHDRKMQYQGEEGRNKWNLQKEDRPANCVERGLRPSRVVQSLSDHADPESLG